MSYYPILKAPGCTGWTTVFNFSPSNWEGGGRLKRYLNLTWSDTRVWRTKTLDLLNPDEVRTICESDVAGLVPEDALALLSLTQSPTPDNLSLLSQGGMPHSNYPQWRATLGVDSGNGRTCYQGEINPFPTPGSLLSFNHFQQFGAGVNNYLIALNIESSPISRMQQLEICNWREGRWFKHNAEIRNNSANIVHLDGLGIEENSLSIVMAKSMSAIPLYFSASDDGRYLSLEHTHPPASSVIHGRRWEAQRLLKKIWFGKVGEK